MEMGRWMETIFPQYRTQYPNNYHKPIVEWKHSFIHSSRYRDSHPFSHLAMTRWTGEQTTGWIWNFNSFVNQFSVKLWPFRMWQMNWMEFCINKTAMAMMMMWWRGRVNEFNRDIYYFLPRLQADVGRANGNQNGWRWWQWLEQNFIQEKMLYSSSSS